MSDPFTNARLTMVRQQLRARGLNDEQVLRAMERVPRHEFVPYTLRADAYRDGALPISANQTISQPYIVALMTELLALRGGETVLEVGTGSGYQTAILCELAAHVYSLERIASLGREAAERLNRLGYHNVDIHLGDGSQGLPDMAPFDAIIVTAAAPVVPGPLRAQMRPNGGRLVIPVGSGDQQILRLIMRHGDHWADKPVAAVNFVPLIGHNGFEADDEAG
jgi:protein-L-isoaspartate(D-aspartate) O-methyltransferase